MSKKIDPKKLTLGDVKTVKEYLKWLEENRGITTTKQAIQYQLDKTDNINWCEWCGIKFIIMDKKAKEYTPKESARG